MKPGLSPEVLTTLAAIIEERSGMQYRTEELEILHHKILPQAQERGFDSLLDYYYFLRYDPLGGAELDALIETLAVHETYFFREADQLEELVKEMSAAAAAQIKSKDAARASKA